VVVDSVFILAVASAEATIDGVVGIVQYWLWRQMLLLLFRQLVDTVP
jgi:hypothetical protein